MEFMCVGSGLAPADVYCEYRKDRNEPAALIFQVMLKNIRGWNILSKQELGLNIRKLRKICGLSGGISNKIAENINYRHRLAGQFLPDGAGISGKVEIYALKFA